MVNVSFDFIQNIKSLNQFESYDHQICRWNITHSDCVPVVKSWQNLENDNIILNIYNPSIEDTYLIRVKVPKMNYQAFENG